MCHFLVEVRTKIPPLFMCLQNKKSSCLYTDRCKTQENNDTSFVLEKKKTFLVDMMKMQESSAQCKRRGQMF